MPWTPSHAAAILPFRRLCPKYLNLPALVAGSMAPDAGYYVGQIDVATYAHTFAGSVVTCVPIGLATVLLFFLLRRPLWFLLPQPHRGALQSLIEKRPPLHAPGLLTMVAAIVIGAWTHVIWDAFTHGDTWVVERVRFLGASWLRIGGGEVYGFTVLQDLSTLAGAAALSAAYLNWLRRQPRPPAANEGSDRWRYLLLLGILTTSAIIATSLALDTTAAAQVSTRMVVVQAAFYAGSAFATLLLAYSVLYFFVLRNKA